MAFVYWTLAGVFFVTTLLYAAMAASSYLIIMDWVRYFGGF